MMQKEREGGSAVSRVSGTARERGGGADILLAPLRTIRKLHAMAAPPRVRGRRDDLRLSSAQQKIWIFSQLNSELPIFNTFRAYKITGPLRPDLLAKSLDEIASRHDVLRTIYPEIDGGPKAITDDKVGVYFESIDSRDQLASATEEELTDYCNQRISEPIELTSGPILRVEVVKIAEDIHLLIMVSHQIVFDGASWSNLNRELSALYESYRSNSAPLLKEIPLQYFDFAAWQGEFLQGKVFDELSCYWKQQLSGTLPAIGLPTREGSSALAYNEGHSLPLSVPADLTAGLKELGKREGATLFVVVLSAFKLLLHQFSGQNDNIVFTSVPCRTRPEFRDLIGLFSNFIPLRSDLGVNPRFTEFLGDLRKIYSGALAHQELPFEYIMNELQSGQVLANESLFQTLFVFENAAKKSLSFPQCELTPLKLKTGFTKFDITLFMEEKDGELVGSLRYKSAKFNSAMIELMISRFITTMEAVVLRPEDHIEDIHCLLPSERSALFQEESTRSTGDIREEVESKSASRISAQSNRMPKTRMESLVASAWGEVLGKDEIGIHDNFFDLGGNSMLLIMLIGRLQKKLQRNISIMEIFRDPTISSFVKRLGEEGGGSASYEHIHEREAKKRRAMAGRRKSHTRKG